MCPAFAPEQGFAPAMLDFVDCHVQNVGAGGYQALAAPGSVLSLTLTGLLTLFVALFGYRMLLGQSPALREGVLALVKIGIVLALATGWPAYRTLVYDVTLRGPAELAATVGQPAGLPGAGGGLVSRLGATDTALVALAIAGAGVKPDTRSAELVPPQPANGFDTFALGTARMLFLTAAIGALAAVRLTAGLLLALGPFFIAFLLFEGTRGWFEGWVRGLGAAMLGALGSAILLGVQLALLDPWLTRLLAQRAADQAIPNAPTELLVVSAVFALALLGVLYAAARVAIGLRLPAILRAAPERLAETLRTERRLSPALAHIPAPIPAEGRSRAAAVADAVAIQKRHEERQAGNAGAAALAPRTQIGSSREIAVAAPVPLGQSYPRRTKTRVSATAGRRDRSA
jgi:type IV secretion system protein VirB6